jgi:L-seryl-tRNA(Ser) seleniumtransferase
VALDDAGIACDVVSSMASVGAGAFPVTELPSIAIALAGDAERWSVALRSARLPVVGRSYDGRLHLDLRTVPEAMLPALLDGIREADV